MNYPYGKISDYTLDRFGSIILTNRYRDTQTDADERFTPATLVSVSKDTQVKN